MADQPDQPDQRPAKEAPAKKAAAKKAPAKKTPAKKGPAKKAAAKKAPAKAAQPPQPAPEAHAALTAGPNPAREAAAHAKESVRQAQAPASPPATAGGDSSLRIPLTIGLAAVSFIVVLLRRLRRS